jgi:HEPN domain-containing protein
MEKKDLIKFWTDSSDRDYITMEHLYQKSDYHWALFIGHLVIEKLLKACYVKNIDNQHPLSHNLLKLAEEATLDLTEEQKDVLVTITAFNIRARYDDYKLAFYKTCTEDYTKKWINEIKKIRNWIKNQLLN